MKKIIVCLSLSVFILQINAQDAEKPDLMHEFGFNVTSFIENFLILGDGNTISGPYFLSYKLLKNQRGLRVGLGGSSSKAVNEFEPDHVSKQNIKTLNYRIGLEWRKSIHGHWDYYIGGDIIGLLGQSKSTNVSLDEEVHITSDSWGIGGGPLVGLVYKINARMSLSTEATLYYSYNETVWKIKYTQSTFNDQRRKNIRHYSSTALPAFIFFNVNF